MSERKFWVLTFSVIFALLTGAGFGLQQARIQGRAEMKRWQDDYYAKQRIIDGFVTLPISDYEYLLKQAHSQIAPAPKPSKGSKRESCPITKSCWQPPAEFRPKVDPRYDGLADTVNYW